MARAKQTHLLIAFILVVGLCGRASASDWKELRGPYLGQDPPGAVPEIFAPGIVSTDEVLEGNPYVSPDGSYLIFDREGLFISHRREDGSWGTPRALGIEGTCPHVSPDGKYLFFLKMGMGYNDVYWVDASVLVAE